MIGRASEALFVVVRGGFVQRGGGWVLGQGLLMLTVFALGLLFRGTWHSPALATAGTVLLVLSGVIGLAGAAALGRWLTPFPKPAPQARLVCSGVYRLMRHPLYTSVLLAAVGWGLLRQSWTSLLATGLLALFLDAKARREEAWLAARFPEYRAYCERVRRFLPGLY